MLVGISTPMTPISSITGKSQSHQAAPSLPLGACPNQSRTSNKVRAPGSTEITNVPVPAS